MSFITDNLGALAVVLIVLAVIATVIAVAKRYKIAKPDEAIVVNGRRGKNGEAPEQRILIGTGKFIVPFIEEAYTISLRNQDVTVLIKEAVTQDKIPLNVEIVALLKVDGTEEAVRLAIQRYRNDEQRIQSTSEEVLMGAVRGIIGSMTVEQVLSQREEFSAQIRNMAEETFSTQGIKIESVSIKGISDDSGYIHSLSRPAIAEAKRIAEISEADNSAKAAEARAEAERLISDQNREVSLRNAENAEIVEARQARSAQAGPLAEAEAEAEVIAKRREAEIARATLVEAELQVTVNKQADAERYRAQVEAGASKDVTIAHAEAEAEKKRLEAEAEARALAIKAEAEANARKVKAQAEAEAVSSIGKAEADALLAKGQAEAEGMRLKAEAYEKYGEAAVIEILAGMIPSALSANAEAFSKVGDVTVFGGLEGVSKSVAGNGVQLNETLKTMFGLDVPAILNGALGVSVGAKVATSTLPVENTPIPQPAVIEAEPKDEETEDSEA